jgi:glycine cleavage system H lipoate-binding protein
MIGNTIIKQAQDKVKLDLNSAREIYRREIDNIKHVVRLTAERFFQKEYVATENKERLIKKLQHIRQQESLDTLNLTDKNGKVIIRTRNPGVNGDRLHRQVVDEVINKKTVIVSTEILSQGNLEKGIPWIDRAFVEKDWYITAYEPITNLAGDIIDMLYVGMLATPYVQLRNRVIVNLLAVARSLDQRRVYEEVAKHTGISEETLVKISIPNDIYCIPQHSWADKHIISIQFPEKNETRYQGEVFLRIEGDRNQVLRLWTPVAGKVIQVNRDISRNFFKLFHDSYNQGWIEILKPLHFEEDIRNLVYSGKEKFHEK